MDVVDDNIEGDREGEDLTPLNCTDLTESMLDA